MADLAYTNSNIPQPAQTGSGGLPGVGADPNAPFWSGFNSSAYGQQEQNQLGLQDLAKQSAQIDLQNKQYDQPNVQSLSDVGLAKNQSTLAQLPGQTQLGIAKTGSEYQDLYYQNLAQAANRIIAMQKQAGWQDGSPQMINAVNSEYSDLKKQFPDFTPNKLNPSIYTGAGLDALVSSAVNSVPQRQAMQRQESINASNEKVATTHADASRFGATTAANAAIHDTDSKVKSAKEVAQIEAQAKRDVAMQQVQKTIEALSPDKAAVHFIMQAAKEKRPLNEYEQAAIESVKADKINQAATQIAGSPAFMTRIMQAQQNNDSNAMNQIYAQINDLAKRQATVGYEKLFNYGNPASKAQPAPQPKAPAGGDGWSITKH